MRTDESRATGAIRETDWTLRLLALFPGPLWLAGLAIASFVTLLFALYRVSANEPVGVPRGFGLVLEWYFWIDVLNGAIIAYLWIVNAVLRRGSLRDLEALRPVLDLGESDFPTQAARIANTPRLVLAGAGLAGATLLGSMAFFDPGFWDADRPDLLSAAMITYTGRQVVTGWLAGHLVANEVRATHAFARLGGTRTRIDLLDLRPLRPFAWKGLRPAAACLVCSSLVSIFWLADNSTATAIGPIIVTVLCLSLLVFLSPMIPLHRAILDAKEQRLDELRGEIRSLGNPIRIETADASARLASLATYSRLIETAREWPIETPTILRFAAFALLGLGSWLGAALVERGLELFVR